METNREETELNAARNNLKLNMKARGARRTGKEMTEKKVELIFIFFSATESGIFFSTLLEIGTRYEFCSETRIVFPDSSDSRF